MEMICKVVGVKAIGNKVKLFTVPVDVEDKEFSAMKAVKNINSFIDNMKSQAVEAKNPDCISITIDEYKKQRYSLGDLITIKVTGA